MKYEIWDTFQQRTNDEAYTRESDALSVAFVSLSNYIADHIDPDMEIGETEIYEFRVERREEHVHHIYVRSMRDQTLMIVRPVAERTVADLYK